MLNATAKLGCPGASTDLDMAAPAYDVASSFC
jgi:hypothetical protein